LKEGEEGIERKKGKKHRTHRCPSCRQKSRAELLGGGEIPKTLSEERLIIVQEGGGFEKRIY